MAAIDPKEMEELGLFPLYTSAIRGERFNLQGQTGENLKRLERILEERYRRIRDGLEKTSGSSQEVRELNNIRRALNRIRRRLGRGIVGPQGREEKAVLATGAPLPPKGER